MTSKQTTWYVLPDTQQLAREVAQAILTAAESAITERNRFKIVLAGGTTPEAVYRQLSKAHADWSGWQIYFGDERCLPPDHPDRNSITARQSWLDHVAIPKDNIYPIPAEQGPEQGADSYISIVRRACPFDLVLLGMGEDGHTASLFPGQVHDPDEMVHAVHDAPKPPPDRISLSLSALNDSREVIILIAGKDKREAVQRWRRGEQLPITQIQGHAGAKVYMDSLADGK